MRPRDTTSRRRARPQVFLHVGEPKTATTFVQSVLYAGRRALAGHGVQVVGSNPSAVFRATQDLRGIERREDDPSPAWDGEWDRLARQALRTRRASVISHELLCAADDAQVARAVSSLRGADVHVVLTVRDMGTLLPAEWQESVKHRTTRAWDDWLSDVIDKEYPSSSLLAGDRPDTRDSWFWRVHDTAALLERWHRHVPLSRVHVITVPARGTDRSLAWKRFAQVLDVPASAVDLADIRANESLAPAETELLRRFNCLLSPDVPDWFYMANVKEPLAQGVLAGRASRGRLMLPAERATWADEYGESLVTHIDEGRYHVVGGVDELRAATAPEPGLHPADVSDDELLEAAVTAVSGQVLRRYRRLTRSRDGRRGPGEVALRALRATPALRQRVYALSERNAAVGVARRAVREHIERSREVQR